jgi:rRNA maturation endonuclease Nob1
MRLDIYRRAEQDGKFSYLAVPETKNIPEEATNTDWEVEARALEVADDAQQLDDYDIQNLSGQLNEKGYAVTSNEHLKH